MKQIQKMLLKVVFCSLLPLFSYAVVTQENKNQPHKEEIAQSLTERGQRFKCNKENHLTKLPQFLGKIPKNHLDLYEKKIANQKPISLSFNIQDIHDSYPNLKKINKFLKHELEYNEKDPFLDTYTDNLYGKKRTVKKAQKKNPYTKKTKSIITFQPRITCPGCTTRLQTLQSLGKHYRKKHQKQNFSCPFCPDTLAHMCSLKRHVSTLHTLKEIKPVDYTFTIKKIVKKVENKYKKIIVYKASP